MAKWLKYVLSIASGFASGAITASQSGAALKGTLIGGGLGSLVALGNLRATAPQDAKKVGGA